MDGFERSLDHGYEANTKTATILSEAQNWRPCGPESYSLVPGAASETTSFHFARSQRDHGGVHKPCHEAFDRLEDQGGEVP
jgi:hypothetical protein